MKQTLPSPQVGEFWIYADGTKNHLYLVLSIDSNHQFVDTDYICEAHLYNLNTEQHFPDYVWPKYGSWKKL